MEFKAATRPEGLKRPKSGVRLLKRGPASDNENRF